jgi:hypothetical protein
VLEIALERSPERPAKQQQHGHAHAHHQAEGPEHRCHPRNGVARGGINHLRRGMRHIGGVFLQQQAKAQILLVGFQHLLAALSLRSRRTASSACTASMPD